MNELPSEFFVGLFLLLRERKTKRYLTIALRRDKSSACKANVDINWLKSFEIGVGKRLEKR